MAICPRRLSQTPRHSVVVRYGVRSRSVRDLALARSPSGQGIEYVPWHLHELHSRPGEGSDVHGSAVMVMEPCSHVCHRARAESRGSRDGFAHSRHRIRIYLRMQWLDVMMLPWIPVPCSGDPGRALWMLGGGGLGSSCSSVISRSGVLGRGKRRFHAERPIDMQQFPRFHQAPGGIRIHLLRGHDDGRSCGQRRAVRMDSAAMHHQGFMGRVVLDASLQHVELVRAVDSEPPRGRLRWSR